MDMLPPLQVTVDARGCSCILDVRLALSRHGLMLALRLAEELKVYLVPTLWQVLDNTAYYERFPLSLGGNNAQLAGCSEELASWEAARMELGLSGLRLYWAGDAIHESSLPKDIDPAVIARFESLAEQLERCAGHASEDANLPLLEGSRDAAALSVAMCRYRPMILTLGEGDADTPPMCRYLESCGIACRGLSEEQALRAKAYLLPMLARCGALELTWAGLALVAVHLVAPQASLLPFVNPRRNGLDREDVHHDWWRGACAFWYALP